MNELRRSDLRLRQSRVSSSLTAYYLVAGALSAVSDLRYPGDDDWRNPDLF